jgi:hypothetical protein
MVVVFAESGRLKNGQFAEMAGQTSLFCEARRSCSQAYPQKMGAVLLHAKVGILQLIEIPISSGELRVEATVTLICEIAPNRRGVCSAPWPRSENAHPG